MKSAIRHCRAAESSFVLAAAALASAAEPAVSVVVAPERKVLASDKPETAAIAAVQRLDERDYVSVVVFDDRIDVLAGAQTASEANKGPPSSRSSARSRRVARPRSSAASPPAPPRSARTSRASS